MATMQILTIFDTKVGTYNVPFFVAHIEIGFRSLRDLVGDTSTMVGRHPADYVLYHLGTYDDQRGLFTLHEPVNMGPLTQFLPAVSNAGGLFPAQPHTDKE